MATLILGTAQFGNAYGITNTAGRLEESTISAILETARDNSIDVLDSSINYVDAQMRLGQQKIQGYKPEYISKFSLPLEGNIDLSLVEDISTELNISELHGLLFHNPNDLLDQRATAAVEVLKSAKEHGIVKFIGVSIYNLFELENALKIFPDLDIVQLPANLLDLDLLDSPLLTELHRNGVQVHVRSAYLQGLVLVPSNKLPEFFVPLVPAFEYLENVCQTSGLSRIELALGAIKNHRNVSAVVIGATSPEELTSTVVAWNRATTLPHIPNFEIPKDLLDPRKWPKEGIKVV